jgi:hypothetical protein
MLLTPSLVIFVTYVQNRWGHGLGGRVIGLPLSTGPFLILIYLLDGATEVARAGHGVVVGQIAVVAYCYTFTALGWRTRWFIALPCGWATAFICDFTLLHLSNTWVVSFIVVAASALAIKLWPKPLTDERVIRTPARWETPMRALVAGALVTTLTGIRNLIGIQRAGVLVSMPIILSVVGPATLRSFGPSAVSDLMKGTVSSLGGSVMFSTFVTAFITRTSAPVAFLIGLVGLIVTDSLLTWGRRSSRPSETIDL